MSDNDNYQNKLTEAQQKRLIELSRQVGEWSKPATEIATEMAQRISEITLPAKAVFAQIEQIQAQAENTRRVFLQAATQWSDWLRKHQHLFDDFAQKVKEFEKRYNLAEGVTVEQLRKYKWFITPSMPISFIFEVYALAKMQGNQRKAINTLYYDLILDDKDFLSLLLQNWEGHIDKDRYKSLKDIFKTISSSPEAVNIANVVVPTLIMLVDGMMIDFLKKNNLNIHKYKNRKEGLRNNARSSMTSDMDSLAREVLLDILFQTAFTDQPLQNPYKFNRHKIMHGENKRYGRTEYMVRLILMIDYLAHLN